MRLVLCNASPAEATTLARAVVEEQLAACVNLFPVRSIYRWDGAVQDDEEVTLLCKVPAESVDALRERLVALHSYDVPEVLVLPVEAERSFAPYVDWVRSTVRKSGGP